jgi:deoxyribonuclease V
MMMYTRKKYPEHAAAKFIRAVDPAEAKKIQEMLRHHCIVERTIDVCEIRLVAGADAAYAQDTIYAAVVVMTFPGLDVVEKTCTVQEIPFPYIPGLLSFREGPAIAEAFYSLNTVPDLLLINGHGYAHPKRIGIASHVGSTEPVLDKNEIIGMAVRTVEDAKPVFVSAGHKVDLAQAVDLALKTTITHRLTEPIWQADQVSRQCRNENLPA